MGNMSGSYGSHYTLWQSITQNWQSIEGNYTNVTVRMYLTFDGSSYYAYTNFTTYGNMGNLGNYSISSLNYSSGVYKDILLAEWTGNISHEADGSKYFSVAGYWNTDTARIGSGSCNAGMWLAQIPRYTTVTNSERGKTVNAISINWATTDASNYTQYSLNGGAWKDAGDVVAADHKSGYYTISGLSPNTTYTIKTRSRRADSGLWSESSNLSVTTYDIARISNAPSFNLGDNETITYTNPSGSSIVTAIYTVEGDPLVSYRSCSGNRYTFPFTDTELDILYKKFGSSNAITVRIWLRTNSNGEYHFNSKDVTITLKGNQKTIRTNISNSWKRGKLWTNVNGTWKRGVLWTNVSGTWKRGI